MRMIIHPLAEQDILDAQLWYEGERAGLGDEFHARVVAVLSAIINNPAQFPVVRKNVQRALVRRFPYAVYYQVNHDQIVILAVAHCRRHSRHWRRRLE